MSSDPLFPPTAARLARRYRVGTGHLLYVEESGPANGQPVLFLHGGPGSGCNAAQRQLFDPQRYRAIFIDQRGAGRSLPLGETVENTTPDLVADCEEIREALGIDSWIVVGGSWGSLLALVYAQLFPESVRGLVLRGIFLGSREEISAYAAGLPQLDCDLRQNSRSTAALSPLAAYARRILAEDAEATRAWLNHERQLLGEPPLDGPPDERQQAKARIQMHYLTNDCFLQPGQLLAGVSYLRHLPGVIIQGMADPVCPPAAAESLRRAWPEALWMPLSAAGHGALSPPIARATIKALDWVAGCPAVN